MYALMNPIYQSNLYDCIYLTYFCFSNSKSSIFIEHFFIRALKWYIKFLVKINMILCKAKNFQSILINCAKKIIFIVWQGEWENVLFLLLCMQFICFALMIYFLTISRSSYHGKHIFLEHTMKELKAQIYRLDYYISPENILKLLRLRPRKSVCRWWSIVKQ